MGSAWLLLKSRMGRGTSRPVLESLGTPLFTSVWTPADAYCVPHYRGYRGRVCQIVSLQDLPFSWFSFARLLSLSCNPGCLDVSRRLACTHAHVNAINPALKAAGQTTLGYLLTSNQLTLTLGEGPNGKIFGSGEDLWQWARPFPSSAQ